ncbi:MAG: hypothetical protein LBO69_01725 [Ignavibacteria bacterium]|jgi:hypothetical protein|nr:hypothetical protein [Ignavibacteria bacterium]
MKSFNIFVAIVAIAVIGATNLCVYAIPYISISGGIPSRIYSKDKDLKHTDSKNNWDVSVGFTEILSFQRNDYIQKTDIGLGYARVGRPEDEGNFAQNISSISSIGPSYKIVNGYMIGGCASTAVYGKTDGLITLGNSFDIMRWYNISVSNGSSAEPTLPNPMDLDYLSGLRYGHRASAIIDFLYIFDQEISGMSVLLKVERDIIYQRYIFGKSMLQGLCMNAPLVIIQTLSATSNLGYRIDPALRFVLNTLLQYGASELCKSKAFWPATSQRPLVIDNISIGASIMF